MFVYNDCRTDARVLREAAALAAAGHSVTIMARPSNAASREMEREARDGFEIVRIPIPHGWRRWWVWLKSTWRTKGWIMRWVWFRLKSAPRRFPKGLIRAVLALLFGLAMLPWAVVLRLLQGLMSLLGREHVPGAETIDWLVRWRWAIHGWARAAAAAAPEADIYHGHDLSGLPGALIAARRSGAPVVYDSHEIFLEAGATARRPRWVRGLFARLERRWVSRVAALVTVNRSLEDVLSARYHPPRTVVLHNTPSRWEPPVPAQHLLRTAVGVGDRTPIALYHGGFSKHRGLEELAAAILEPGLERVHAVYLGYGSQREWLEAEARDPKYGGRLHVLAAVPPDRLLEWVVDADVGVLPIQASTLNHSLSTPNKLFECLAAGVPVVASDFGEMRRIVAEDPGGPLGELCDPADPASVAAGIRRILDLDPVASAELRRRCLTAAHERWNWETESARLVELYADLGRRSMPLATPGSAPAEP